MATKIRLQRRGKKDTPIFRIVVAEKRTKRDGKVIDLVGVYNPKTSEATVKIDKSKLEKWLSQGAKPTEAVRKLLSL